MKDAKQSISLSRLAYELFPQELSEYFEEKLGLFALLRRVRAANEQMAFDIWRYLLVRAGKHRRRSALLCAYEFRFEPEFEMMHLNALRYDEHFREALFRESRLINERQVWLLYLALKHDEFDLFDDLLRRYRRNFNRFLQRGSYSLDVLLLRLTDRLRGRVGDAHMSREVYDRVQKFAEMVAHPHKRKAVLFEAKDALRFYLDCQLPDAELAAVASRRVADAALKNAQSRVRESNVKRPVWEDGRTMVPYRIAGLRHYLSDAEAEECLPIGAKLSLVHDRENRYDTVAVALHLPDGRRVGYIGKPYNRAFCELLQNGVLLTAEVTELARDVTGFLTVWVTIFNER